MSYPIILCEDQIIQLNQLERIIEDSIENTKSVRS